MNNQANDKPVLAMPCSGVGNVHGLISRESIYLMADELAPESYLTRAVDATLSGGEHKRIELASVLAMKPKLVILDEPDLGIDALSIDYVVEVIRIFSPEPLSGGKSPRPFSSHQSRLNRLRPEIIPRELNEAENRSTHNNLTDFQIPKKLLHPSFP
jgi:hypothetical protein